tara:strand:+ start:1041 stop:1595 length:555 start_codon:yes stop_codon:yes gene_type:complete
MILPIYIYGHPILRKQCKSIDKSYLGLDKLINDMFETMHNAYGIGISAPQVGLDVSIFVIDLSIYHEEDPSVPDIKKAFINPEIIEESGNVETHNEGCLSIPGVRQDVDRKSKIRIRYSDMEFQQKTEEIDGLYARVFQHEYDHLNGILFVDHLSPLKKNIVNRKLVKIEKGKFEDLYPTVLRK